MRKSFKKITAAVMAVATLAVGMAGMSASAATVGNINLHKVVGAPGSDTVTSQQWNFTTASSTTIMSITSYTKNGSDSYVSLISTTGIGVNLYGTGSGSATNVKIGQAAIAKATLNNFSSGNHLASGKITG